MTNTQTFGMFPAVEPPDDSDGPMSPDSLLFPPPPPPMFHADMPEGAKYCKLMKWYQVVEHWCAEPGVKDNQRAIVAPPPRPPPVVGETPVLGGSLPPVPYGVSKWEKKAREWWAYVARIFDRLRLDPLWEVRHVSRAQTTALEKSVVSSLAFLGDGDDDQRKAAPHATTESGATTSAAKSRRSK